MNKIFKYIFTHTGTRTEMNSPVLLHESTYTHTRTHAHSHAHIHTHTLSHTHVGVQVLLRLPNLMEKTGKKGEWGWRGWKVGRVGGWWRKQ